MSDWTHPQCEACWVANNGSVDDRGRASVRRPTRMVDPGLEVCCFCGQFTIAGIFVRADPRNLLCEGEHSVAS